MDNPLGKATANPTRYAPEVLYPIPRWASRSLLEIDKNILMYGLDHWRAYELSWLNLDGKPQVAIGEFYFDAQSTNIIESKSLKLYLNSLNQERYQNWQTVESLLEADLSQVSESEVKIELQALGDVTVAVPSGRSIDHLPLVSQQDEPNAQLLQVSETRVDDETLCSDLFRSNCPVTGQPDWASLELRYTGQQIVPESLLAYLCSFRQHQAYHEECAERIFRDVMLRCRPQELRIGMNFLRRGGLDINVYRSTVPVTSDSVSERLQRQ